MGIKMSCLKSATLEDSILHEEAAADSANLEDSTIHKAAADGDLKTLKKLVKNLDDKNPPCRGVVPGGAMAPPDFGRSVNPISTRFSDLPTALNSLALLGNIPIYLEFCFGENRMQTQ